MSKPILCFALLFLSNLLFAQFNVGGILVDKDCTTPMQNVQVDLSGTITGNIVATGNYNFSGLSSNSMVTITPSKTDDMSAGVSVLDMIKVRQAILFITNPTSSQPFFSLAADVNASAIDDVFDQALNGVSTYDLVLMSQMILGLYNGPTYRFVDKTFNYTNGTSLPQSITFDPLTMDESNADFIAIKLGDVTGTIPHEPAFSTLSAQDAMGCTGETISVSITADDFNSLLGVQFSINWDPAVLTYQATSNINSSLSGLQTNLLSNGTLSVLWNDFALAGMTLPNGTILFDLDFQIAGNTGASSNITFGNTPTLMEAVDINCDAYDINTSAGSFTVSCDPCANDMDDPTPVCMDNVEGDLSGNPTFQLWGSDMLEIPVLDNCSSSSYLQANALLRLGGDTNPPTSFILLDCSHIGANDIQVFVYDEAGNESICWGIFTLTDNSENCPTTPTIAGMITKKDGVTPVANTTVMLSGTPSITAPAFGNYSFSGLNTGDTYTVTPNNDINPLEGVSTEDLVYISNHILGINPITDPCCMIAADANNSGTITTLDLVVIRRLLLGIDNSFQNNTSWRFVDQSYVFPDPNNPFIEAFPESIEVVNLNGLELDTDFYAIKIGNVSECVAESTLQPAFASFSAGNAMLDCSTTSINIPITVQNFMNIQGFQFSLNWDSNVLNYNQIINVNPSLSSFTLANVYNSIPGLLNVSWNDLSALNLPHDAVLFEITFDVLGGDGTSTNVSFANSPLNQEVTDSNLDIFDMNTMDGMVGINCGGMPSIALMVGSGSMVQGGEIFIMITVDNFDDIQGFQFSTMWDPSILSFNSINNEHASLGNEAIYGTSMINSGALAVSWFDMLGTGVTLPDGSTLFEIAFDVIGATGSASTISLGNNPVAIEFLNMNGVMDFMLMNGMVTVITNPPNSVSCGDNGMLINGNF